MSCAHAHDCADERCESRSLHPFVDRDGVVGYNVQDDARARDAVRPWSERRARDGAQCPLTSDVGQEIVIVIPFMRDVAITGISAYGGLAGKAPRTMQAYANRRDVDATNAARKTPTQEWELARDDECVVEYATDQVLWRTVTSVTLYFPKNFRDDGETEVWFIGLRGEAAERPRQGAVIAVYESRGQRKDHEVPEDERAMRFGV